MRLEFLPAAIADLRSIELYLYRIDPDLSARFVADVERAMATIIERPLSLSPRDALVSGLRAAQVKPYTIYFLPTSELIKIVRILHQAQDVRGRFDR